MTFILISSAIFFYFSGFFCARIRHIADFGFKADYLINNLPCPFCVRDFKGRFILCNNEFLKMVNKDKHSIKNITAKNLFGENFNIESSDKEAFLTRKSVVMLNKILYGGKCEKYYRILKTPVFNKNGTLQGFLVIFLDAENELKLQNDMQSFLASVTHDLKTPTAAQISILNMLINQDFGVLNSEQIKMIDLTKKSCEYMQNLVKTILYSVMSEDVAIKPNKTYFDFKNLVYNICDTLHPTAVENNISFEYLFDKQSDFLIFADKLQIERVVVNLISNAVSYSLKNTTVKISFKLEHDVLKFWIENQSMPIPDEDKAVLFKKYKKTKLSCFNKTSTGLGLYLSKQIIDSHNGNIFANSSPCGIWQFGFELPAKDNVASVVV